MPSDFIQNDEQLVKMFNTYHGKLEKINEEICQTDYINPMSPQNDQHKRLNTDLEKDLNQDGTDREVTVEKPRIMRPQTTFNIHKMAPHQMLVTPKLKESSNLTTEA